MYSYSIIIPVYNAERYLATCLESCLCQTHRDIEIICVNDGSSDSSEAIVERYARTDDRVRLVSHEKNESQYIARHTGVSLARNDYVMFLDSDDYLEPSACRLIDRYLSRNPVDVLQYGYAERPSGKKVLSPKIDGPDEKLRAYLAAERRYPPELWTKAYRRETIGRAFAKMTRFYATLAEDLYASAVITHNAKTFGYLDACLVNYRVGSGSTTRKHGDAATLLNDLSTYKRVTDNLRSYLKENAPEYLDGIDGVQQYFISDFFRNRLDSRADPDLTREIIASVPRYFDETSIANYLIRISGKAARYERYFESETPFAGKCKRAVKCAMAIFGGSRAT